MRRARILRVRRFFLQRDGAAATPPTTAPSARRHEHRGERRRIARGDSAAPRGAHAHAGMRESTAAAPRTGARPRLR